MARKPYQTVVLNAIAAAGANVELSGGKLTIVDASGNPLMDAIRISNMESYTKTAYAAGTPSVKDLTLTGVTLVANTVYTLEVEIPGRSDFSSGGGQESNAIYAIRSYSVSSGSVAPTANQLEDLFTAAINNDQFAAVTASSGGVGVLRLTLDSAAYGDMTVSGPTGSTLATVTPYVAPSGTPTIVAEFAPNLVSATGEYSTWKIGYNRPFRSNFVNGNLQFAPSFIYIFADENDADFGDFETALDAVLDGTHTPVADYLGV